jgi:hypothetical protein
MDTTTPVDGVASDQSAGNTPGSQVTEPTSSQEQKTTEAVADDSQATKELRSKVDDQSTSTDQSETQTAVSKETVVSKETEAKESDEEIVAWAEKKGLKIDPANPNEINLARINLKNDRRFHANQTRTEVTPPEEVALTGNESIDQVIDRQNVADTRLYVRDWFDANPDMKEHRQELTEIAQRYPDLQNMEHIKAHFLSDPSRSDQLKREGGREALTNLAQKQQAVPPSANATNATVFESSKITPENVEELVGKNDSAWYDANRDAIRQAAFGDVRT